METINKIDELLNAQILFAEDCNSEVEFHDLQNLKAIIEEENEKIRHELQEV